VRASAGEGKGEDRYQRAHLGAARDARLGAATGPPRVWRLLARRSYDATVSPGYGV